MHIGIVSHVSTKQLSPFLDLNGTEPSGTDGATAPNLLIIELLKKGFKISVFALTNDLPETGEYVIYGTNITIYYFAYRKKLRDSAFSMFSKERNSLKCKILEVKPDILHAHWQYEYSWAALSTNLKTIVTCRDSPIKVLLLYKNAYRFIRLIMAYIVLKKAVHITATSKYLSDELKKFGVKKNIHVIPNFEPDWLFELPLITKKNLSVPKIIMINNGFDQRKNVEVAFKAFNLLLNTYPNAELHMYGKGYAKNEIANDWAKSHNLDTNVYFNGYLDFEELMSVLYQATILLHTSREETFGNIITESMAMGIPVVAGESSGAVPWVVGLNQLGGILVDIENPNQVERGIHKVLSEDYASYCKEARLQAKSNFSSDTVISSYINLYLEA